MHRNAGTPRYYAILAALSLFVISLLLSPGLSVAQQVEDVGAQQELALKREVLIRQERIRLLYSQGQYTEAIEECNALLRIDAANPTAVLMKDRAEQRLATGQTEAPVSSAELSGSDKVSLDNAELREFLAGEGIFLEAAPTPAPAVDPATGETPGTTTNPDGTAVPVRNPETSSRPSGSSAFGTAQFSLPLFIAALLGLIVLIIGMGALVAWIRARRAPQSALATAAAYNVSDLPTVPSQATGYGQMPRTAGQPQYAISDVVTQSEEPTNFEVQEPEPQQPAPIHPQAPKTSVSSVNIDLRGFSSSEAPKEEEVSSLGIDYSETDEPMLADSQAYDVEQTKHDAITSFETPADDPTSGISLDIAAPPAPVASGNKPSREDDISSSALAPDEPSGIDLGFAPAPSLPVSAHDEQTHYGDDAPAEVDPRDATYNSLMFGSTSPAVPGMEDGGDQESENEETRGMDDLTRNSFNREYSDVMFGAGSEDTKVQPEEVGEEVAHAGPSPAGPEAETLVLPGHTPVPADPATLHLGDEEEESEMEKTLPLPEPVAASSAKAPAQKGSMFEQQRDAGRDALESGDYAKAVQCLSVAASLKPGDKEVRTLLEEARRKRRGV